jgi:acyl carrier protein
MDPLSRSPDLDYPQLADVFADVFQYVGPVDRTTSPREVPRWDSLQHIALVTAIERAFGVTLSMDEMMEMRSVGAIEAVLRRHGV